MLVLKDFSSSSRPQPHSPREHLAGIHQKGSYKQGSCSAPRPADDYLSSFSAAVRRRRELGSANVAGTAERGLSIPGTRGGARRGGAPESRS
ncbi:hypothetical protein EVAR_27866_1 [Eumeta japonica]|uniref:Uncharacterized protein n=1 Tax=Eumeta variegata TaxID=151549 RepID=A0A4C1VHW1_EUMVA|nr:hypothetical protein EVAR_27866_1 [Eumeta japonica]